MYIFNFGTNRSVTRKEDNSDDCKFIYEFDNDITVEFYKGKEEVRRALIDIVIDIAGVSLEDARAFVDTAKSVGVELCELFEDDLHDYYFDEAYEMCEEQYDDIAEQQSKEYEKEIEELEHDYRKAV